MFTKIVVHGQAEIGPRGDRVWTQASIDGGPVQRIKITIRRWLTDGHPLVVYINGNDPLYPTVVYAENDHSGKILGYSAGVKA